MSLERIYDIPLKDINISDRNVRVHDATTGLDELAASIEKHGLLQPVVLLGHIGNPPYELISGQRRFLAHKKILKAKEIRAVFAGPLSKTQAVVRSLVENLQRREVEYRDIAEAITDLYEHFDKDERRVQEETGLSIRRIREYIRIESQASPKMKRLLQARKVSPADVKRALRAAQNNIRKAEELLELIVEYKPTPHQKRRLVQYGEKDRASTAKKIFNEAMKPYIEESIVISLPAELRKGLVAATKRLAMEPEELASKILIEWLRAQGFVK
jgi:ParB family transcriptional regulator, chromosome partitioning protein